MKDHVPQHFRYVRIESRRLMSTHTANFSQFARPEDGSYDPICFDARRRVNNREYPIVRLDHEEILSNNRIGPPTTVSHSFYRFVSDVVAITTKKCLT